KLHYVDPKVGVDAWESVAVVGPLPDEMTLDPWDGARVIEGKPPELERQPLSDATFAPLTPSASRAKSYAGWQKALEEWLYQTRSFPAFRAPEQKAVSRPGESEGDFRVRVAQSLRERRDV